MAKNCARKPALCVKFAMNLLAIDKLFYVLKPISFIVIIVSVISTSVFLALVNISEQQNVYISQIFHQHTRGSFTTILARDFKMGKATIERWYHQQYLLANKEIKQPTLPQVLALMNISLVKNKAMRPHFAILENIRYLIL